jgi:hypothetical protein
MIKKLFLFMASGMMLGSITPVYAQEALDFDGADDYVSISPSTGINSQFSNNQITLEGWYYPTVAPTGAPMLIGESFLGDGNILFTIYQSGATITAGFYDGSWETTSASITLNTWQHIACTYDQTQIVIYINGVVVSTVSMTNPLPVGTEEWRLGLRWDLPDYYQGKMDEVRVWNVARTQAQILDNMYCSLSGSISGLVANYTFDKGTPNGNNAGVTTLTDMTGNSYDGTLNNFALSGTSSNWVNGFGSLNANAQAVISANHTTIGANTTVTFTATPLNGGSTPSYQWMKNGSNVGTNNPVYTDNALADKDTITCMITSSSACTPGNVLSNKIGITVTNMNASLAFDGNDDYITTTLDADADVMPATTWEAWIYPTTNDGNWRMVCSMEDGGWDRFIAMNSGQLWVGVSSNGWNPVSMTVNQWQHVAVVYTATDVKFYLNGVEYVFGSGEGGHLSNGLFTIGANEAGTQNFQGLIDEVHVWNIVRTKAEIQQDMRCGFAATHANLVANYNFNEGIPNVDNSGVNTLVDASGNSNNGTLYNFSLNGTNSNWTDDVNQVGTLSISGSNTVCPGGSVTLTASSNATAYLWSANTLSATTASVSVSPVATSTYVVATANGGCSVTDSIVVSVISTPIAISGPSNVCLGNSVTLTASGVNTYTWTSFDPTPLDNVPSGQLGIGLRKLRSAYTGKAIRLRRSSDNAEQDFGFVGTELDTAAIRTFLGGAQGFCTTMYDQSGAGGDVTQSDPSRQPLYVVYGLNGKPVLRFDGNAIQNLYNSVYYPAPFTAIYTARQNGPNRQRMLTSSSGNWLMGWWNGSNNQEYFEGWVTLSPGNSPSDSNPYIYSGTSDGNSNSELYQNGVFQYNGSGGLSGPSGIALGAWNNTGEASDGDFTEVFVFSSVLSASDRQLIENSTGSYYGILSGAGTTGAANTFTPSVNTSYIVTGTDNNGCQNTSMITVMVNALPVVTAAVSTATICSGTADTLSASGATTYTWSSNAGSANTASVSISPSANDTYTVTGTDNNGCQNTNAVSVTVNSLPTVTAVANSTVICTGTSDVLTASGANTYTWSSNAGSANTASVSVSPSANDTYTVTGTDNNGCQNTNMVSVTVNSLPAVAAVATSTAICTGASDVLTASGANTYTWSSNAGSANTASVSVSPSANDTYTVAGTDGNGCTNTDMVSVAVNSLPSVTATITSTTVCLGMADTLNASGATTYTWSSNAGSANTASVSVSPVANDTYTLTGTDVNGCANTSTVSVIVNSCSTGINGQFNQLVAIYPNPSRGMFTVETRNLAENTTLVIYDCIGQIAYTQQLVKAIETVDLKLAAGIYTLKLQSSQGVVSQRIMIQQ